MLVTITLQSKIYTHRAFADLLVYMHKEKRKRKEKEKQAKIQLPHKQCISFFDIRLMNVCPDFKRFTMYVRLTRKNYDEFFGLSW